MVIFTYIYIAICIFVWGCILLVIPMCDVGLEMIVRISVGILLILAWLGIC